MRMRFRLVGAIVAMLSAFGVLTPAVASAAPATVQVTCNQPTHAFISPAGPTYPRGTVLTLAGIVQPGTRVIFDFYRKNQSPFLGDVPFLRFGTTFARSNCVIDERDGDNTVNTAIFPTATTSVYASYVRWEDGVVVLNQFYGKIFLV